MGVATYDTTYHHENPKLISRFDKSTQRFTPVRASITRPEGQYAIHLGRGLDNVQVRAERTNEINAGLSVTSRVVAIPVLALLTQKHSVQKIGTRTPD